MIATYNYPGASSFRAVHFANCKKDKALARKWWQEVHESHGPCAPGGGDWYSDKEAASHRYNDGTKVHRIVLSVHGHFVRINK